MDAMPFYRSPVFVGLLVSVISQILALSGLSDDIPSDQVAQFVDLALQVVSIGAGVYAAWKRKNSAIQPLTLTKGGADAHPATVANTAEPNKPQETR